MTLQDFDKKLKELVPESYHLAAPQGATRYVVWHSYGGVGKYGDDRTQLRLPRVQLDIVSNSDTDTLDSDVDYALWLMELPYEVIDEEYDPDTNLYRRIWQLVVI